MAVILPSRDAAAFGCCAGLAAQVAARGWDVLSVEPRRASRPALAETGTAQGVRRFVLGVANAAPFLGDTPSESLLCELFAGRPVDAIHLHLAGDLADPAIMERGWLLGVPLITSVHAGWHPPPGEPAQAYLTDQFTRADLVCVADQRGLQADWLDPGSPVLDHSSARSGKGWADVYRELVGDLAPPRTGLTMSVVVTVDERPAPLRDCLAALCRQTLPATRFEVVVVDDGAAEQVVLPFQDRLDLTFVRLQPGAGVGAARNAGVEASRGDILCFLDGGDEPAPRCLAEHLRTYAEHGDEVDAVLGWTGPTADLATSVEAWLAFRGLVHMSHEGLRHLSAGDWYQFWGRRYTIRRSVLGGIRFEVPFAEDADVAYRLADRPRGLRVVHNRHAVQRVRAGFDALSLIHRAGRVGQARARLAERHPSLRTHPAFRGTTYEATARKLARRTDARLRLLTATWPVAIEDLRARADPYGRGTLLDRMHADLVTVNSIEVSLGWLLACRRAAAREEGRPLRIGVSALSPLLDDVVRELAAAPAGGAVLVVGVPPGHAFTGARCAGGGVEADVLACDDADDLWRACDVVCAFTPPDGHDPYRHALPLPRGTLAGTLRDLLGTREHASLR
ncbi:glycosyltransferase family 2 protein [Dactylosporangium sp. NPDC049525]|uniref:glycosyltransferase family 2 protein n=1 Tax=Dactylosporangium sp. NPDC049525 TaxID=3154730 RepID=UPI0034137263